MSGPKCSEYELNEARKREELRKLKEEVKRKIREENKRKEEARRREEEQRREEQRREEQRKAEREDNSIRFNEEVEERAARLAERLYKKREQEIIAEAIDEAMVELGYDLIALMGPKAEDEVPFQAQVFSFAEGVGVQVTENGGRISMEVVGLGTNNRRPTEEEGAYLEHQMENFCDVYGKLEAKLEEKGIVKTTALRRLPPDKKYARILNLDQFEPMKKTDTLQTVMRSKTKKASENVVPAYKKKNEKRVME